MKSVDKDRLIKIFLIVGIAVSALIFLSTIVIAFLCWNFTILLAIDIGVFALAFMVVLSNVLVLINVLANEYDFPMSILTLFTNPIAGIFMVKSLKKQK